VQNYFFLYFCQSESDMGEANYINIIGFFPLLGLMTWFVSAQVQISELRLLSGYYNYKLQPVQAVTMVTGMLLLLVVVLDIARSGLNGLIIFEVMLGLLVSMMSEWFLSRWSPHYLTLTVLWRIVVVALLAWAIGKCGQQSLLPFVVMGLYLRNNPFGVVHGKPFFLAYYFRRSNVRQPASAAESSLVERGNDVDVNRYDVTEYGISPDTGRDMLPLVQALIDKVGHEGGGVIFFPRGRYLFNLSGKKLFLQINSSHITLEGERDKQGRLLTELVNGGTTIQGKRNPWLSPFFITTGESIQPSNIFWGLDFRKPKGLHIESSSLSDPGSDGKILTPLFATRVIEDSKAGSSFLHVEDSSALSKYVLLGMYNTSPDAELLKDLLGVDEFREEWITARRAGEEQAPSFQWLVEVKRVVDRNTIELCRPLLRDCLMKYEPAIFNVDMLEDIHIRHLRISSRWNGLFRHHGFPLYYSISKTQEMDYGWNAINMKRVAHATVENVEIKNFTNPLYVQDSRNVTVEHVSIKGYDGHQGIKVYCHTCDCLFRYIDFYCHFADMMGGEGNAYSNTFRLIRYLNPTFHPVDYDFHGFSEGPMSPPAYNLFEQVSGFRYIKGAGAPHMQPACGIGNTWRQCVSEGGRKGDPLFCALSYRVRPWLEKYVTAIGYTVVVMIKKRKFSIAYALSTFTEKLSDIDHMGISRDVHHIFFPQTTIL
jgi:hypothetical protein